MKYLIPSSLLLLMSSLCADEVAQMQSQSMSRDPCCPPPKPCCPPKQDCIPPKCAQLVGGPKGEITPNAGPCVACGADLYLTVDFIYWTVREDHLGFAYSTGTNATAPVEGRISQLDFKMEPGFKVGAGILFDHDGWDIFAEYTWIRSRNVKGSADLEAGTVFLSAENWGFVDGTASGYDANWSLHYFNVIDLELGRNFYVSRYLKLRPHFGFKGTWQKQFFNDDAATVITSVAHTAFLREKQFYWGFGIRAGLDAAFHFSRSFSTFGEIAVSGLWGQFEDNRLNQEFVTATGAFVAPVGGFNPRNVSSNFHTIKPVMEWMIGLRWETYTCDKEFHFAFEAAWEEQYWLGQNQFISTSNEVRGGDLSFQGLTVKFRFDF
ncbi:MAG TPA: Lpg1974 family pore-forming outer membrane protein [Rhabdochlamydiaceae bacterium]|nr:Lpg1974 family pore-forming outer membrane protein [Rhabdochlamydiaceae bacterium]